MTRIILVLLIPLALLIAGCDAAATPPSTNAELSQTFSDTDLIGGTITVNYPAGWFQAGNAAEGIRLGNDQALLEGTVDTLSSGQILALVVVVPGELAATIAAEGQSMPVAIINTFGSSLSGPDAPTLSEVQSTTLAGKDAAVTTAASAGSAVILLVVDIGGSYAMVVGSSAPGELNTIRPTIEAIASSVQYQGAGE